MRRAAPLAIVLAIASGPLPAQAPVPEPDGHRTEDYRQEAELPMEKAMPMPGRPGE
jgi:hypothetical protein